MFNSFLQVKVKKRTIIEVFLTHVEMEARNK